MTALSPENKTSPKLHFAAAKVGKSFRSRKENRKNNSKRNEIMRYSENNAVNLSAYKIYWAEFTPVVGKFITKKDIAAIRGINDRYIGRYNKYYRHHFPSKDAAIKFINAFNKKLSRRYMVRLFTDKQFGMAKREDGYAIPYTKKQLEEVYYIG